MGKLEVKNKGAIIDADSLTLINEIEKIVKQEHKASLSIDQYSVKNNPKNFYDVALSWDIKNERFRLNDPHCSNDCFRLRDNGPDLGDRLQRIRNVSKQILEEDNYFSPYDEEIERLKQELSEIEKKQSDLESLLSVAHIVRSSAYSIKCSDYAKCKVD